MILFQKKIKIKNFYKFQQRNMQRATNPFYHVGTKLIPMTQKVSTNMSTLKSIRLHKKAAKDLCNDNGGQHTHIAEEECVKTACNQNQCPVLCDKPKSFCVKGHNTHKPPIGRFHRIVSQEDAAGNQEMQYYVPHNARKHLTPTEKAAYGSKIKDDLKQQPYVDKYRDVYDKE